MLDALLPVHPLTGLTAVGVLPSGRIVWPVLGGAGDGDSADDADAGTQDGNERSAAPADADDDDADDDDADGDSGAGDDGQDAGSDKAQLAEAGRKALAAERAARRKADKDRRAAEKARRDAEAARKAAEDRQSELQAQLARLAGGGDGSDDAAAAAAANEEKIRREADETAAKRYSERVLRSEIRVAAAGKMNDPADALRLLDLTQFEAGDDGEFDTEEITNAIEDLVKDKPYLAAPAATAGRFQGTGDGGARDRPRKKGQLTRAELQRMKPAEITKAKAEGRLDDLLAGKS